MQKANVTVLIVIAVVVAGLVAAEWYFFDYRQQKAAALDGQQADHTLPQTSTLSGDTSGIIECVGSDGEKFYTNAENCEEAELPPIDAAPQDLEDG